MEASLTRSGDRAIEVDVDRPKPSLRHDRDVVVQVAQTGICGSDVHYWHEGRIGDFVVTGPMVLGHESSGVVTEVGDKVKDLRPGDKVALEPGVPCRYCTYCKAGHYNLCDDMAFAATPPYDGTLAKYYNNDADFCFKLPENMDLEEGALVEPLAVAVNICKTADLRAHQTVLVLGSGPIGVLSQAVAKAWGATRVVGVDVMQSRLDIAKKYGADATFVSPRPDPGADPLDHTAKVAKQINEVCGLGEGPDVVLECSGAEACIQIGIFAAKKGAIFVQAGMGKDVVALPISAACTKALKVHGSFRYKTGCYPAAIDLISSGKVAVKGLITDRFAFEDAEKAFELVKAAKPNVFKVLIQGVV